MRCSWLALLIFVLVCQLFVAIYVICVNKTEILFFSTNATRTTHSRGIADTCSLQNYSSWDPEIMKYSDVYTERKTHVCEKPEEWAYLEQQVLKSRSGYRCRGRCVNYNGSVTFDKWQEEETKFDCDFIETECNETRRRSDGLPADMRGSVLFQIVENRTSLRIPPSSNQYNIYVILVDSVAALQSRRNLPKSLYFMNRELEAVEYSFVNKLGKNSYPNGIPLWYGRTVEGIEKQMLMGQNKTPADWETICNDSQKAVHILSEAEKVGYKTLSQEYWWTTMLHQDFPCTKYTEHFRPGHGLPPPYHGMIKDKLRHRCQNVTTQMSNCEFFRKTLSEELTSYFSQFMNSYKNSSKFGWLWLAIGSHYYESESMTVDTEIYDFFIRNKEELDNSFVFFMSDHGLRYGSKMDIKLGEYDNRNPFLAISMPKELRGGRLMENLRKNSRQLQTHYDTRATMLDIMKYQPAVNYTAWKMEQFGEEKGNSYLREQPGPRTCHTLPIPFQYCICQYKMEKIDSTSQMGKTLANSTLAHINQKIIDSNHTSKCGMWQLKEAEIEGYYPIRESGTFQIQIKVRQDGWENGAFRTTVRTNSRGHFELAFVGREDSMGNSGDCIDKPLREYCYCKK